MLSKAANDLQGKYKMLKNQKLLLERELEIVDKEKIQSLQTPALDLTSSALNEEIKTLEEMVVKFKVMKGKQQEKLESLQDLLDHYKRDIQKKVMAVSSLKNDKTRYSEYRSSIESSIKKHSSSGSHSTASGNSSFVQYTPQNHNSSAVSDLSSSRVSHRSARWSLFAD
jgi:arginine/lysine/ornithine decarboxylase